MNYTFKQVDLAPVVKHYIEKAGIIKTFQKHLDHTTKSTVPISQSLGVMIMNILISSKPLYQINEWFSEYADGKAEDPVEGNKYNDDRLGKALDVLYKADRQSLQAEIASQVIKEHDLEMRKIHNDTTTITFSGAYEEQPEETIQLKHGHNKDGRPDDKQIVYGLNITEDGHVPISFNLYDGNQNDDTTHQTNWDKLKEFITEEEFVYIADCKLCSQDNLKYIAEHGGKFITAMPSNHLECKSFLEKIRFGEVVTKWSDQYVTHSSRKQDEPTVYKVLEGEATRNGYRMIWVHSKQKAEGEEDFRKRHIEKAEKHLKEIQSKLNKRNLRTLEGIKKAVKKSTSKAEKFIQVNITEKKVIKSKFSKKGKPSKLQPPIKTEEITTYNLDWNWDKRKIEEESKVDGIYPLVTNIDFSPVEVLKTYKHQSHLEKRFYTKKSVLEVAPVFLKSPKRIEAIMFLYFISLMVIGLIERFLRSEMTNRDVNCLPILPSKMKTKSPTWRALRNFFRNVHLLVVKQCEIVRDCLLKGLTSIHREILQLLGIPEEYYLSLGAHWWVFGK